MSFISLTSDTRGTEVPATGNPVPVPLENTRLDTLDAVETQNGTTAVVTPESALYFVSLEIGLGLGDTQTNVMGVFQYGPQGDSTVIQLDFSEPQNEVSPTTNANLTGLYEMSAGSAVLPLISVPTDAISVVYEKSSLVVQKVATLPSD